VGTVPTQHAPEEEGGGGGCRAGIFYKNMYKLSHFMPISTIFTALFYPYIARERTAQNLISSVRSERSALCSRSAIAPKMKVHSRAKSDLAISKSDVPSSDI